MTDTIQHLSYDDFGSRNYYIQDYQGNIRMTERMDDWGDYISETTVSVTDYYPYGNPHKSSSGYKYSGKYLDRSYGLDLYNFEARMYDAVVPGFDRPDPLAGNLPWLSPYTYCANNPVNLTDQTGMMPSDSTGLKISDHIYSGKRGEEIDGYRLVDIYEKNSLRIGTYVKLKENGGMDVVVANAGTNPNFSKDQSLDIVEDFFQRFMLTADMKLSINYAQDVKFVLSSKDELTFVGHSKGGAEATMNAIITESNALLYDPAPVSTLMYGTYGMTQKYKNNPKVIMKVFHVKDSLLEPLYLFSSPIKTIIEYPPVFPGFSPISNHKTKTMRGVIQ